MPATLPGTMPVVLRIPMTGDQVDAALIAADPRPVPVVIENATGLQLTLIAGDSVTIRDADGFGYFGRVTSADPATATVIAEII